MTDDATVVLDPVAPATPAPPATTHGLEADSVSAWFGRRKVLDRVSLDMPAGQVTALIGPSGCGKSTFLRILNRMHELVPGAALAGEVRLDGVDIYHPERRLTDARKSIGMVFQKPNPFPAMSIEDNVLAGLKLTGTRIESLGPRRPGRGEPAPAPVCGTRSRTASSSRARHSPAVSSSACASHARWPSARECC